MVSLRATRSMQETENMPIPDNKTGGNPCSGRLGAKDGAALAFLFITGFTYFGLYYDNGFSISDEGSVVLITKRLLEGERPYVDVSLGYGLLWYYPLILLFKITGVHFIAARIFFLALAMVTSLLAFLTIRRQTCRWWLATIFALLLVMVPGTLHKSFIPLIVVANMLCLPLLDHNRHVFGRNGVLAAGLVAAVSYHIRPDLGFCAGVVLTATLAAHTISRLQKWPQRAYQLARLSLFLFVAALVPTLPLILIANRQGFLESYLSILYQPFSYLGYLARAVKSVVINTALFFFHTKTASAVSTQTIKFEAATQPGTTLQRMPLAAAWEEGPHRDLSILTYLPILTLAVIVAISCVFMLRRNHQWRSLVGNDTVGILALAGLSYSAFPQFFLFRPDSNHLSQFMPGHMVLVGVCLGRWLLPERDPVQKTYDTVVLTRSSRLLGSIAASILILHTGFYIWFGLHRPETGSIAQARGRNERFVGENGIDVAVNRREKRLFTTVVRIVDENTNQNDVVLCFPYCPGFNVMTNRRTFMRRLYVDDSLLVMDPGWQQRMIDQIETEKPALVIIRDWAANGTDISRFQNWATQVMEHIVSEYVMLESVDDFKFYMRRV